MYPEGEISGMIRILAGLVREGVLNVRDAAAHAGMSESDFEAELKKLDCRMKNESDLKKQ